MVAPLRVLSRVARVEERGAVVEDPLAVEGGEAAQQEQPALLRVSDQPESSPSVRLGLGLGLG